MRNAMIIAAIAAAAVVGGVVTPMLFDGEQAVDAQKKAKEAKKDNGLGGQVMDATQIRAAITEMKKRVVEGDDSLEQLELRAKLKRYETLIAQKGDKAKITIYKDVGDDTWRPSSRFDAKGLESGLALRAQPESFEIFETRKGDKLILLDSRTGDTWYHTDVEGRGKYWAPLPRSAERFNIVPRNYSKESGFKENRVEHRHRRSQIIEMMEELNRELEEMKGYEKR